VVGLQALLAELSIQERDALIESGIATPLDLQSGFARDWLTLLDDRIFRVRVPFDDPYRHERA
jgi:hypothetical protein